MGNEGDQQEEDCYHHGMEMRMLRGILGVSRRDHMRNEEIRCISHVSPIDEVMHGGRLRWFGHVLRRDPNNVTQSDGPGNTRYQTTRTSQEDTAPTNGGRHDGRGCYTGQGRPLEIGNRPTR